MPDARQHPTAAVRAVQGVLSLWRGHMATLLHRLPYSAVNFAVFEASNKALAPRFRSRSERGTVASEVRFPW
jgi:Mitochondrial carrier protein